MGEENEVQLKKGKDKILQGFKIFFHTSMDYQLVSRFNPRKERLQDLDLPTCLFVKV